MEAEREKEGPTDRQRESNTYMRANGGREREAEGETDRQTESNTYMRA
jgi:hypothetical protein